MNDDPQEQYVDPAFGGCDHLRDSRTCEDCAAEAETGTVARIRWTEEYPGTIYGHPGTLDSWGFELWLSDGHGDFEAGEWVLTVPFVLGDRLNMNGRYKLSGRDPGELKTGAERLLSEFISSLGAVWPEPPKTA